MDCGVATAGNGVVVECGILSTLENGPMEGGATPGGGAGSI